MELLLDFTVYGDHLLLILHDLVDPSDCSVDAVPGSLQVDPVAGYARPREGDYDSTEFITDFTKYLAASSDEVLVMLGVHSHDILDDVVQLLDTSLKLNLGLGNRLGCTLKKIIIITIKLCTELKHYKCSRIKNSYR